jgi:hypothetical protein
MSSSAAQDFDRDSKHDFATTSIREDENNDDKHVDSIIEEQTRDTRGLDEAAKVLAAAASSPIQITPDEDRRILRKIDKYVLPAMLLVYFLQQLDKSSLSYTAVFDIVGEANLVGTQYSWLSSIVYLAQLVFQPLSSYALVKLPVGKWVFFNVLCWGACVASSAAARNFVGLFLARMFLGVFEASIGMCIIEI